MAHDDKHNETVGLFAVMNLVTGEVFHATRVRHTGRDILAFFKSIDRNVEMSRCRD